MNDDDERAIVALLAAYEDALHRSDTEAVMKTYAPDGIFMAQNSPSSIGAGKVRASYDKVFAEITLDAKFTIEEVVIVTPGWAFARTNSAGNTKINATGERVKEANQELFIFEKLPEGWKIARYCFSTTNPARGQS